jgi:hypothetical protein
MVSKLPLVSRKLGEEIKGILLFGLSAIQLILLLGETYMGDNTIGEEGKKVREFLPFWAKELLAMKDEAESKHTVHGPSVREGS